MRAHDNVIGYNHAVYSVPKLSSATALASSTTTTGKRKKGASTKTVDDRKSPPETLSPEMQARATSALNDLIRSVHVLDDTMSNGIKVAGCTHEH